jgi:predicted dehydrogenase
MGQPLLRWGILGTAGIAKKNWQGIRHTGNGIITAVASRELARSRRFIDDCQAEAPFPAAPRAVGSYEELLAAPDIDAVYIPLPTGIRKEWVIRAAAAGKHVVCEKPCAINPADLAEMLAACRQRHVQFMDGVMFMHSARLARMREVLDDGKTVGRIKRVSSAFSFRAPEEFFATNIRAQGGLEPLGCLGDLGWYCIRFALWAANWKLPKQVTGRLLDETKPPPGQAPVPTEFSGELLFADGMSAGFYCSFRTEIQQWGDVSGTLGSLYLPDFVIPSFGDENSFETRNPVYSLNGCDFKLEPHVRHWTVRESSHNHPTAQETNLFRRVAELAQSGAIDPFWPEISLQTQQVVQACMESAHVNGRAVDLKD